MNSLIQQPGHLLASSEALENLQSKHEASILVFSDSHGDRTRVRHIMADYGSHCDACIFCGDGIGDLCYTLTQLSQTQEGQQMLPPVIGFVQGNGDPPLFPASFEQAGTQQDLTVPAAVCLKAAQHTLLAVHGHIQGAYYSTDSLRQEAKKHSADIVLYGHTHMAKEEMTAPRTINPGSCSRPRGGMPPSIAVLNITAKNNSITTTFFKISPDGGYTPFLPDCTPIW